MTRRRLLTSRRRAAPCAGGRGAAGATSCSKRHVAHLSETEAVWVGAPGQ